MEEDRIDRSKEYEILGRILVNFEKLSYAIRSKIFEQMCFLGLDFYRGQSPLNILLAKIDISQLSEKFRSLHTEIFKKEHLLTNQINLFSNCMVQLIKIRNLLLHATWFIGFSEFSGSEEDISRGFNDRYGKGGLSTRRIYFSREKLVKIDDCIKILIKFLQGFEIDSEKNEFFIHEKLSEEDLKEIFSFLIRFHKNIDTI